ncbi:MAG: hypothetical protein KDC83_15785, partial [Flavobacteriales bacterium]|nr:hypothetical protein [Flavobacteriales bacterium]
IMTDVSTTNFTAHFSLFNCTRKSSRDYPSSQEDKFEPANVARLSGLRRLARLLAEKACQTVEFSSKR